MISSQGDFYCIRKEETIQQRIKAKGKTVITPNACIETAEKNLNLNNDPNNLKVLESNLIAMNVNMINSKADQ